MNWEKLDSYSDLSARAAEILLGIIHEHPHAVIGLPTGRTPLGMYDRVASRCEDDHHCFATVTTFNLDEYVGIPRDHPGSYASYMDQHLFDFVDINPANAHIPNGAADDLAEECRRYEAAIRAAGGLGTTFLGLGRNGHIGFNEPGTSFDSRTRVVELTESTRKANADLFEDQKVPTRAITMGIATILESKKIVLLASGESKREALAQLRSGEITEAFPASALWRHADVTVLISE